MGCVIQLSYTKQSLILIIIKHNHNSGLSDVVFGQVTHAKWLSDGQVVLKN